MQDLNHLQSAELTQSPGYPQVARVQFYPGLTDTSLDSFS